MSDKKKYKRKYILSVHTSWHLIFYVFCLMLLPFNLLTFITGTASANSESLVEYNLNQEEQDIPVITDNNITKTLWQNSISLTEEQQDQTQKDELQLLIEQINSMELSPLPSTFEAEPADEPEFEEETEDTVSKEVNAQQKKYTVNDNKIQRELISNDTIMKLREMTDKLHEVKNPYEIGNTLYLSNCLGEAAVFYQEALRRRKPEDISAANDRAWLLFQAGNCLSDIDMLKAADLYGQLITEYPDSPWADVARIQSNVIAWYTEDKPNELINEYKR